MCPQFLFQLLPCCESGKIGPGRWLLASGCWLLVSGPWLLVTDHLSQVTGRRLPDAGCWYLFTGRLR